MVQSRYSRTTRRRGSNYPVSKSSLDKSGASGLDKGWGVARQYTSSRHPVVRSYTEQENRWSLPSIEKLPSPESPRSKVLHRERQGITKAEEGDRNRARGLSRCVSRGVSPRSCPVLHGLHNAYRSYQRNRLSDWKKLYFDLTASWWTSISSPASASGGRAKLVSS
jgi:hypothetical protein